MVTTPPMSKKSISAVATPATVFLMMRYNQFYPACSVELGTIINCSIENNLVLVSSQYV